MELNDALHFTALDSKNFWTFGGSSFLLPLIRIYPELPKSFHFMFMISSQKCRCFYGISYINGVFRVNETIDRKKIHWTGWRQTSALFTLNASEMLHMGSLSLKKSWSVNNYRPMVMNGTVIFYRFLCCWCSGQKNASLLLVWWYGEHGFEDANNWRT